MSDPLIEIVSLLKPTATLSKLVRTYGRWRVKGGDDGRAFYAAITRGEVLLSLENHTAIFLREGDFVLIPSMYQFQTTSPVQPEPEVISTRVQVSPGVYHIGHPDEPFSSEMLIGHCAFTSLDTTLLLSLLPSVVHVTNEDRLIRLMALIHEETLSEKIGRELILERLLDVLLLEAMRVTTAHSPSPGLLRGLADERLCRALRIFHANIQQEWTVQQLARSAAMSRAVFFERFKREIGMTPSDYMTSWRMALAKQQLLQGAVVSEIAEQIGYGSASAFTAAFKRHVGIPPGKFRNHTSNTGRAN